MNDQTMRALARINERFYAEHAASFAGKRQFPWAGWQRVIDALGSAPRVLDVGCGHARFGAALLQARPSSTYGGVEPSAAMRDQAQASLRDDPRVRLVHGTAADVEGTFDLVAAFGVLHHLPAAGQRQAFARDLSARVSEGGALVLTVWQLGKARFARRVVPWSSYAGASIAGADPEGAAIDVAELEAGDLLLAWGTEGAVRYCHQLDRSETEALISASGMPLVAEFEADGRSGDLNRYLVLSRDESLRDHFCA